jgi:large subunit ribosomal protein L20
MSRVTNAVSSRRRRKRVLEQARGYRGPRGNLYKLARESVHRALRYQYRDRRVKKRDFRALWIARINAAARLNGMSYSLFMNGLKKADVRMNRKILADIAVRDEKTFAELVQIAKGQTSSHA